MTRYYAIVAETKDQLRSSIPEEQSTPSVDMFIERAAGRDFEEVTLRSGADVVALRNEDAALNGERLTKVAATYTEATVVTHATARSRSGRVTVDFGSSTGTGHTRSSLLMADLLGATVPLTVSLDADDKGELAEFLAYESGPNDLTSVMLFESLDGFVSLDGLALDPPLAIEPPEAEEQ